MKNRNKRNSFWEVRSQLKSLFMTPPLSKKISKFKIFKLNFSMKMTRKLRNIFSSNAGYKLVILCFFHRLIKAIQLFPLIELSSFLVCLCVLFCVYRHCTIVVHENLFDVNETQFILTEQSFILQWLFCIMGLFTRWNTLDWLVLITILL